MNIVAFVPIKMNSVRLKNKNILPVGGKPMCWHIFNALLPVIEEVYVYASSDEIMQHVPKGVGFLKRPKSLDQDKTLGMEIYSSFIQEVDSDFYCLAHATSPFLSSSAISRGIESLGQGHDSAFTVRKEQTFAWHDGRPINYSLDLVPRTQDMKPVYIETSGCYMFDRKTITSGRRIGDKPFMIEVGAIEGLDVDELQDYELAVLLALRYFKEANEHVR